MELRGRQGIHVTVVNLRARIRSGLPILRAVEERRYYGVDDPSNGNYSMLEHEILCPWEIIEDEIVGTWGWEDVQAHWYQPKKISSVGLMKSCCLC